MTATIAGDVVTYRHDGQTFEATIGSTLSPLLAEQLKVLQRGAPCGHELLLRDVEAHGHRGDLPHHYGVLQCTLPRHEGDQEHICITENRVAAAWGARATDPDQTQEQPDPEPPPFKLETGKLYKFKNRPTVLVVVRQRPDGQVEVLDLTHERYRVLQPEQLVPRPANAEPPTVEQMKWVATYLAKRREEVRKNALTQRDRGYFKTEDELNNVLRELSLRPLVDVVKGTSNIAFSYDLPPGMSKDGAKKLFDEWRQKLELPPGLTIAETSLSHSFNTRKE